LLEQGTLHVYICFTASLYIVVDEMICAPVCDI